MKNSKKEKKTLKKKRILGNKMREMKREIKEGKKAQHGNFDELLRKTSALNGKEMRRKKCEGKRKGNYRKVKK